MIGVSLRMRSFTEASCQILESKLTELLDSELVAANDGLWSINPLPSPLILANGEDLLARALKSLLRFVDDYQHDDDAFAQVRNSIALARKCGTSHPKDVAPVFMKLDRLLKRRGDKHLVLEVAEMSINAARRADPRGREEVEAEARALICGVSWVYQRLPGHLDEAKVAYDYSRNLASKMHLDESLAYSAKCLGRYHRMVAEEHPEGKDENLRLSEGRLKEAIERFSNLASYGPEDHEVGDAYSLLGRTYLVGRKYGKARDAIAKAYPILAESNSKEFLDLLILLGELEARSDKVAALSYFDKALELRSKFDSSVTEIRARAFPQRGLLLARMGRKSEACRDLRRAVNIWHELNEVGSAASAEWDLIRVEEKISGDTIQFLESYPTTIRVNAANIHLERMSKRGSFHLSSRTPHDRRYWQRLVKEAQEQDALHNIEW